MSGPTTAGTHRLGFWLVTAAALCWSSGGLIARLVGTDAWTTVFWRSVFCATFLLGAVALTQRGRLTHIAREAGWPGLLMAACFATASTARSMAAHEANDDSRCDRLHSHI